MLIINKFVPNSMAFVNMVQGLISADHRLQMCNLACKSSDFIMVDPWEVLYYLFFFFGNRTSS